MSRGGVGKWRTFNLVDWIRARRLQWVGHIICVESDRLIKQAVFEMFKTPQKGDLLMDVPTTASWRELDKLADDRDYWKERVCKLAQQRVYVDMGRHFEAG